MLMALTRPSMSADLANLDIIHRTYSQEGVTFLPILPCLNNLGNTSMERSSISPGIHTMTSFAQ